MKISAFVSTVVLAAIVGTAGAQTTITRRIALDTDDMEIRLVGGTTLTVDQGSSDLELGSEGAIAAQTVALRFQNITIPADATITNAYIQFEVDPNDVGSDAGTIANYVVRGEANNNPVTYDNVLTTDIPGRTLTTASVNWNNIPKWVNTEGRGLNQRTPDLKAIVQEIIGLSGWASGNAMAFQVDDSVGFERTALSYEGSASAGSQAPDLVVTFTVPTPLAAETWSMYE